MNAILWLLQVILGLFLLFTGIVHFALPENLPAMMAWMYDLTPTQHLISGLAEILGGLGLILPGLVKIMPRLTSFAAAGLVLVMAAAAVFHYPRGEFQNMGMNIAILILLAIVAVFRWNRTPLTGR